MWHVMNTGICLWTKQNQKLPKFWKKFKMFLNMCDSCFSAVNTVNLYLTFMVMSSFIRTLHSPTCLCSPFSMTCLFCKEPTVFYEDFGWITWHRRTEIVALSVPAAVAMTGMRYFLAAGGLSCNGFSDYCAIWQLDRHRWQTFRKRHCPP